MEKQEATAMIDQHKNRLVNPVEMLHWTWLRVIINNIDGGAWQAALEKAEETMSR